MASVPESHQPAPNTPVELSAAGAEQIPMTAPSSLASRSTAPDPFREAFGEPLGRVLDLASWRTGEDLDQMYERIAAEVEAAVRQEGRIRAPLRGRIFPRLRSRRGAPKGAGVYRVTVDDLKRVHRGLLFTGAVEACDATQATHDTLPLTVTQIGVALVAYNGHQGTWVQRLFRRDLRESLGDPAEEALALLERREDRGGLNQPSQRDQLTELARRAIMTFAERAILLRCSTALWRLGHGSPAPYELLTGSAGTLDLMIEATRLLEELICGHQRFVFVPSEPSGRPLLTIGNALEPLEYAIVETLRDRIWEIVERSEYYLPTSSDTTLGGRRLSPREWIQRFRDEIASQVVVGVYRASELAPAQLFYAHVDHAHEAALIALADSVLQPHRGFPMLIDLADHVCAATFGSDSLAGPLQLAYTRAGAPLRYLSERMTRAR